MQTITLKYVDTSTYTHDFDAVDVDDTDYKQEKTTYTKLDWTAAEIVHAEYKRWKIQFGILDSSAMDFLNAWKRSTSRYIIISSVEYGPLAIEKLNNKHKGGTLVTYKQSPE